MGTGGHSLMDIVYYQAILVASYLIWIVSKAGRRFGSNGLTKVEDSTRTTILFPHLSAIFWSLIRNTDFLLNAQTLWCAKLHRNGMRKVIFSGSYHDLATNKEISEPPNPKWQKFTKFLTRKYINVSPPRILDRISFNNWHIAKTLHK